MPKSTKVGQRLSLNIYLFLPSQKAPLNFIGEDKEEESKDDMTDSNEKSPALNSLMIAKALAQLDHSGWHKERTKGRAI